MRGGIQEDIGKANYLPYTHSSLHLQPNKAKRGNLHTHTSQAHNRSSSYLLPFYINLVIVSIFVNTFCTFASIFVLRLSCVFYLYYLKQETKPLRVGRDPHACHDFPRGAHSAHGIHGHPWAGFWAQFRPTPRA